MLALFIDPAVMDQESPQGLNIVSNLSGILHGQTNIFDQLNSKSDKRLRERVRYSNLSPLAKQNMISKISEGRLNRNSNTIPLRYYSLFISWFMYTYFFTHVALNICLLNSRASIFDDIAGLNESGQTCVTQTWNVPVTRGIVVWNFLNCVLTYVNHCDVLTPVYCFESS